MPIHTIIRPEFGEAVIKILDGVSPNQAAYKTGVSDEYIRKMAKGRVPSEVILQRFAEGLGADLQALRIAAGYEQPSDPVERVELALRGTTFTDAAKEQILDLIREMKEKYVTGAENREQEQ